MFVFDLTKNHFNLAICSKDSFFEMAKLQIEN
jgi:hypothetical protein